jgi:hypothetical protein
MTAIASMPSPAQIAAAYSKIVVHDDTVQSVVFRPGKGRTDRHRGNPHRGSVEVLLYRYWEKCTRQMVFRGCVNADFRVDATMLAFQMPSSTAYAEAIADTDVIRQFIQTHTPLWNCSFDPPGNNPVIRKLAEADQLVLFRLVMFGGLLEVVAKSFAIRTLEGKASPSLDLGGEWGSAEYVFIEGEKSKARASKPRTVRAKAPRHPK